MQNFAQIIPAFWVGSLSNDVKTANLYWNTNARTPHFFLSQRRKILFWIYLQAKLIKTNEMSCTTFIAIPLEKIPPPTRQIEPNGLKYITDHFDADNF